MEPSFICVRSLKGSYGRRRGGYRQKQILRLTPKPFMHPAQGNLEERTLKRNHNLQMPMLYDILMAETKDTPVCRLQSKHNDETKSILPRKLQNVVQGGRRYFFIFTPPRNVEPPQPLIFTKPLWLRLLPITKRKSGMPRLFGETDGAHFFPPQGNFLLAAPNRAPNTHAGRG